MSKSLSLTVLRDHWHDCQRCKLSESRENSAIVFGAGMENAKYLFVLDVPTLQDAEVGRPLNGRMEELFVDLLRDAKMDLGEVYVTAMLGCWPATWLPETQDKPAQYVDRDPETEEVVACLPRVTEIIYRIDPLVIFTMGYLPFRTLVRPGGKYSSLDKALGEMFVANIRGRSLPEVPYDVIPLLGMKAMLASPSYAEHGPLATTAKRIAKGKSYATWLETIRQRDARHAGFAPRQDTVPGAGSR